MRVKMKRPNVVFVFADQMRSDTGFAGNRDVSTPVLDKLAEESMQLTNVVSTTPVCTPYRACLMTGQYPLTHGVFLNDVRLKSKQVSLGQAFQAQGYDTAYIGKWHLDGADRSAYIPPERRHGFDHWQVLNCTHNYMNSLYYEAEDEVAQKWDGYDAEEQTKAAQAYIRQQDGENPFLLILSWGPPHDPYDQVPDKFKALYDPDKLILPPNVDLTDLQLPDPYADPDRIIAEQKLRRTLADYYAHISALDTYTGWLMETLREQGMEEDTIFIFTSDHGDMLGAHGEAYKIRPWDESVHVPFLLHYPRVLGRQAICKTKPIGTPDLMPTLLGLCELDIPETVEGLNYAPYLYGKTDMSEIEGALICVPHPFADWSFRKGGREYRGVRTERYTYVSDLNGPWLMYDNYQDPYQLHNLVDDESPEVTEVKQKLSELLSRMLAARKDAFLPSAEYVKQFGYELDEDGCIPYKW